MTNLSKHKLRNIASYCGALTLASATPLFAHINSKGEIHLHPKVELPKKVSTEKAPDKEIPKEASPEAIIEAASKAAAETEAKENPPMDPALAKKTFSYGLGYQNGEQFGAYGFIPDDFDKEAYLTGLIASLSGEDFGKNNESYQKAMTTFQKIVTDREIALAKANEVAEKEFMEKNGKREGVITTESKLQYEILKKGTGKTYTPPADMQAPDQSTEFLVHCSGSLLDGTTIMKTPKGEPFPFNLNALPGITEALQIMPIGSKWKLYIPSALAFGQQRQGPKIEPSSTLIYELELTDIKTKPTPAPQMPGLPPLRP